MPILYNNTRPINRMKLHLAKYNRHWEKGHTYPYPKTRRLFNSLLAHINTRLIVELTGLRRVGKSTLFFQLINHLQKNSVDRFKILYFTFDEEQPKLDELFNAYQTQAEIDYKNQKIYVFLDEIQKLPGFQNQIKIFYDLYPNMKFFISGSASLFIRKKSQESLAGRINSFILKPLSFDEFLKFKDKQELLQKPMVFENEIKNEFEIYFGSQFIDAIGFKTAEEKKQYCVSIIKKIVFEDLPTAFPLDNPDILYRMVNYIAQKPGCVIDNIHLAEEVGISAKTVKLYLSYLENSFLIKKLYNFSTNLISSEKRSKKYYLASSSFSLALTDFLDRGALFENYISSLANPSYFWRDPAHHEVDFVFVDDKKNILPVEAKFTNNLKNEHFKNLLLFMKKYSLAEGQVIYAGMEKKKLFIDGKTVNLIPFFNLESFVYEYIIFGQ